MWAKLSAVLSPLQYWVLHGIQVILPLALEPDVPRRVAAVGGSPQSRGFSSGRSTNLSPNLRTATVALETEKHFQHFRAAGFKLTKGSSRAVPLSGPRIIQQTYREEQDNYRKKQATLLRPACNSMFIISLSSCGRWKGSTERGGGGGGRLLSTHHQLKLPSCLSSSCYATAKGNFYL